MKKHKIIVIILTVSLIGLSIFTASAEEGTLKIDTEASCITSSCHSDMGKKKSVHAVGVNGILCYKCHEIVKQGEHRFKKIPSETRLLCSQCHSKESTVPAHIKGSPPKVMTGDKKTKLHVPFAEGKCTECHDPHESNFYKHLKTQYPGESYASFSAETYSLCIKCHKEFLKALTEPRTLTATGFRNGNLNLHYRHVNKKKGRTCKLCHHYHGSENPRLINMAFLFGKRKLEIKYEKTDTGGSCATACHRIAKYDRYDPVNNYIKTTPLPGRGATEEELRLSKERDMQKLKQVPEMEENKFEKTGGQEKSK